LVRIGVWVTVVWVTVVWVIVRAMDMGMFTLGIALTLGLGRIQS
jgi:hypothetical protein